nr:hypothetical protein [Odoribacter splanchnicus]
MWLRTSFVSIILVICLYSCDRRDNSMYSPSLLMLEDSLEAMPEKFLRQILEMDTTSLRESDRAFHYFLLAKAKVLVPHSPELLLDESDGVLSYFANRRDSSRLCQLYYFLGRLYADRYAFLRANASYNQAEKFVGQNIRMLFAIKVGEAYIYRFKMMHGMEEECLKRALNIAGELNDSSLMAEAMHELAELCIFEKNYVGAENRLRQALELLPQGKTVAGAEYNKDLARVYLAMNKLDSALYYTDIALQGGHPYDFEMTCNILKGNIYLKKHCLKEAEHIFLKDVERLSLKEKQEVYYKMSLLKKEEKDFQSACEYAEKSIRYRDSLEVNNKAGYISNLNAFQEHERQQRRIARMNMELSEQELSYYRLAIILSFVLLLGVSVIFHVKQAKKKVEVSLKEKELTMVRLQNNQWVTEVKYLQEKRDREALEVESLNQRIEYYKRLNALTVPILMKRQNSQGAMHLKKEEWDIIIQNTDACFNNFTLRLEEAYPQLTLDEIRFACLLKMEFSLSLLSEVYHIAKGSISRKKMRLKEKMQIENMTLDDFIKQF